MTDMSWLGLFKRGIKLQCLNPETKKWVALTHEVGVVFAMSFKIPIRYKHPS